VMAEASKLDLKEVLFRLSRNKAGPPPINLAVILFSRIGVLPQKET
jgi:hypothetical protein